MLARRWAATKRPPADQGKNTRKATVLTSDASEKREPHASSTATNAGTSADPRREESRCGCQRQRRRRQDHRRRESGTGLGEAGPPRRLARRGRLRPNVPIMLGATQQPEATQDKRII